MASSPLHQKNEIKKFYKIMNLFIFGAYKGVKGENN